MRSQLMYSMPVPQNKIAVRACHLLKVGGRLVYSTCTFNPIEDEAVVANVTPDSHVLSLS